MDSLNIDYLILFEKHEKTIRFDEEEFDVVFAWENIRLDAKVFTMPEYTLIKKILLE